MIYSGPSYYVDTIAERNAMASYVAPGVCVTVVAFGITYCKTPTGWEAVRANPPMNETWGGPTLIYYISPSGSASNDGLSSSSPKTLDAVIDELNALGHVNGDVVIRPIAAGTYTLNTNGAYFQRRCRVAAQGIYIHPLLSSFSGESLTLQAAGALVNARSAQWDSTTSAFTSFADGDRFAWFDEFAVGDLYPSFDGALRAATTPTLRRTAHYAPAWSTARLQAFDVVIDIGGNGGMIFENAVCRVAGCHIRNASAAISTLRNVILDGCKATNTGGASLWMIENTLPNSGRWGSSHITVSEIHWRGAGSVYRCRLGDDGEVRILFSDEGIAFDAIDSGTRLRFGGSGGGYGRAGGQISSIDFDGVIDTPIELIAGAVVRMLGDVRFPSCTSALLVHDGSFFDRQSGTFYGTAAGVPVVARRGSYVMGMAGQPLQNTATANADVVVGNDAAIAVGALPSTDPDELCRVQ